MTKGDHFGAAKDFHIFFENRGLGVNLKIFNSNPNQVVQHFQGIYKIIRIEQIRGR